MGSIVRFLILVVACLAAPARLEAQPVEGWATLISAGDCSTTTAYNPGFYQTVPGCQEYANDLYENWDPLGTEPGAADLLSCDAGYDGTWYYQKWVMRNAWTVAAAHRYYIELEIDQQIGGDTAPDIYFELAPKPELIGTAWVAAGDDSVLVYQQTDNLHGAPNPLNSDKVLGPGSTAYDTQITIGTANVYARVNNGNLEVAFLESAIDAIDGSADKQPYVALRCWAAQTTSIPGSTLPAHDFYTQSDFTGFRIDNNMGVNTGEWPRVGAVSTSLEADRGDAPLTNTSYGDPQHLVVPNIYLGATPPDIDVASVGNVDATGDDASGVDDEDGVTLPVLYAGGLAEITVTVNELISGVSYLQAWMDFGGDGSFANPGDQIAADLQDGGPLDKDGLANGTILFDVTVPASPTVGNTFARFRWSTVAGVTNSAPVGDGEVEDYQISFSYDPPILTCSSGLYQVAGAPSVMKKMEFTNTGSGYSLSHQNVGIGAAQTLDGSWGYNAVDGYAYGLRDGTLELWQLDGAGEFYFVTNIPATAAVGTSAGDVLPNGVMLYPKNATRMQLVDISVPATPTDAGDLVLTTAVSPSDMAYNDLDGMIYGIDGATSQLFRLSANNGTAGTVIPVLFGPATYTGTYGAIWFDQGGRLYVYNTGTNAVYLVDLVTGEPTLLATSTNDEGGFNDGMACRGFSPIPFGSITGELYVDQNANDAKDAGEQKLGAGITLQLYNDNGTPGNLTDDTFVMNTETDSAGSFRFANVSAAFTYRIDVDLTDPEIPAYMSIGTLHPLTGISVAANATTPAQDFGFDSLTADLSITKTARRTDGTAATDTTEGEAIDWVVTVTNAGPAGVSGVQVRDQLPSGFSYVSDDATGNYTANNGLWQVGALAAGASRTLTIRTQTLATGDRTNLAEVVLSSALDPDSDPAASSNVDDLGDGIADDDEAQVTLPLAASAGAATLSGQLILDIGSGLGGVAHDGLRNGTEAGVSVGRIEIVDGADVVLAPIAPDALGNWSTSLPAGYTGPVTVRALPPSGYLTISENPGTPPALSNPDTTDGSFTFTPDAAQSYGGLDIGIIPVPRLDEDQATTIRPGQIAMLPHRYVAGSDGTVSYSIPDAAQASDRGFVPALFLDAGCDGSPDGVVSGPIAVQGGEHVCLLLRVSSSSGLSSGAEAVVTLLAETQFSGTTVTHSSRSVDKITIGSVSALVLSKTVENITQGTGEGTANAGRPGDRLLYRIYFSNRGAERLTGVVIYDRTPPYTALSAPVTTPRVSSGLTCTLTEPATNNSGFAGPLRWECAGPLEAGAGGDVDFEVLIQ
ncbi:DUF11 domain-containing protein [Profundibacterium mesophilum]|nr:DUF11 domain-containing protein [Profundibacterium mesophilum]